MDITALRKDLEQIVIESYSLKELNLLVSLEVQDKTAAVKLYKAALNTENRKYLSSLIADLAVKYGFKESQTEYIEKEPQYINHISKIIAVMSGKGGVGKSMAASLTAVALSRTGLRVGILDADITGPSIAKMFGINGRPPGNELGFLPLLSRSGISIISTNLLLDDEHSAVIWRGGMISKAISQFYNDVLWGNLDYLVVDMPPGTSDAALTVLGTLPVNGVVMVYTPQDLTAMIVKKAFNMVEKMNKSLIGLVENMSYVVLPNGTKFRPFGSGQSPELWQLSGAPLLGVFPIDSQISTLADSGLIENYLSTEFDAYSEALLKAVKNLPDGEPRSKEKVYANELGHPLKGCSCNSCSGCLSADKDQNQK